MKKLFTLMALFAALVFMGCSNDEDGGTSEEAPNSNDLEVTFDDYEISGGTPYSGDLLGTWECILEDDGGTWIDITTYNSDGSFGASWSYGDDWSKDKGLFFVKENVLVLQYMVVEYDYYGSSGITDYISYIGSYGYIYFYIVDTTSEYIKLEIVDYYVQAFEVDWDRVDDMIENTDSYMTGETILYYKSNI